jgi:hypothetical protein
LILEQGSVQLFNTSDAFNYPSYWPRYTKERTVDYFGCGQAFTKIIPDTTDSSKVYDKYESLQNTGQHCFSVYAKAAGYKYVQLYMSFSSNGGVATFNLDTGEVEGISNGAIAGIENFGNGIYRIHVSDNITQTGGLIQRIQVLNDSQASSYVADGSSGVELFGPQLEEGFNPSSLIFANITSTTYTRDADVTSSVAYTRQGDWGHIDDKRFDDFYNQTEGTVFVNYQLSNKLGQMRVLALSDGTNANFVDFIAGYGSSSQTTKGMYMFGTVDGDGGSINASSSYIDNVANANIKFAGRIKLNDYYGVTQRDDGTYAVGTDTIAKVPFVNRLNFGDAILTDSQKLCGHIRKISYYSKALSDAELVALTENN